MRLVIGLDPGPSTGIAWVTGIALTGRWEAHALQCDAGAAMLALAAVIASAAAPGDVLVQGEAFVTGNRAGAKGRGADAARDVLADARQLCERHGARMRLEPALNVMHWSSDKRLEKAGFPMGSKFLDARAAGRHMMHAARWHGGYPDPLIRAGKAAGPGGPCPGSGP